MLLNNIISFIADPIINNKEVADSISNELKSSASKLSSLSFDEIIQKLVDGAVDIGMRILIAIVVFYIGKLIINKIHTIVKNVMIKHSLDKSLTTFVLSLVKITLLFVLIVSVIGILGIETSSFIAIFASAGVAIGMALSGTLQNFAGGVLILFIKPYKIGDYIEFGNYQGTVKEIQIFNTILNTPDNKSIIIPNGGLSTGTINNYSKEEYRRLSWDISISYGDDVDVARKVALDILREDDRVVIKYREDDREMRQNRNELAKDEKIQEIVNKIEHKKTWIKRIFSRKSKIQADVEKWKEAQAEKIEAKIPKVDCSPSVFLTSLADSSIVVTIRAWTRSEFYWSVLYDVNEKIYKEFPLYKEAVDCLQNALNIKPESLEYLSELADCYCELEQYRIAQDIITKVLYLNKHFIFAHLMQAKLYLRQKRYTEALKVTENAIKLDSSCAEAYKYQAEIFAAQGLKNRSIESAKIAVSLQPAEHTYYAFLAKLYFDAQEYETAFLYYKEASMLDELNVNYLYSAAQSADKAGIYLDAANYYSYALRQEPFNNLIIYEYVDFLKRNNKLKQALSLLKTKIDTVDSENIAKVLQQKYDELKAEEEKPLMQKIGNFINNLRK